MHHVMRAKVKWNKIKWSMSISNSPSPAKQVHTQGHTKEREETRKWLNYFLLHLLNERSFPASLLLLLVCRFYCHLLLFFLSLCLPPAQKGQGKTRIQSNSHYSSAVEQFNYEDAMILFFFLSPLSLSPLFLLQASVSLHVPWRRRRRRRSQVKSKKWLHLLSWVQIALDTHSLLKKKKKKKKTMFT